MGGVVSAVSSLGIPEPKFLVPDRSIARRLRKGKEKRRHDVREELDDAPARKKLKCERTIENVEIFKGHNRLDATEIQKCPFLSRLLEASQFPSNRHLSGGTFEPTEDNFKAAFSLDEKMEF